MIKNERQYRITKAQAEKFEQALARMDVTVDPSNRLHPLLQKAQRDALRSQLDDLRAQLAEYEALRSGARILLTRESFEDLPSALIQARIASGLSQKELADRLGLKEQQVQRYEATEYASASLDRVLEVIKALGISIRGDIFLPNAKVSPSTFFKRLQEVGFKRDFVLKRMLPRPLAAHLQQRGTNNGLDKYVLQAATVVCRILRCTVAEFFDPAPLRLNTLPVTGAARFKALAAAKEPHKRAYAMYAHHMALLSLQATADLPIKTVPTDACEVRKAILSAYGPVTFENALKYAWDLGITVLPLRDPGAFHGACWRVEGRNVVVLKQQTVSVARWLFDFLHEYRHAGQDPELDELYIIEPGLASEERRESEEQVCSEFAGEVLLDGRAEDLVEMCVAASKGRVELLSNVVPQIARRENVSVGALANHMAYRLWQDGVTNWWGPATNLQEPSEEPWRIARDTFLQYANFGRLNEVDRSLLEQALSDVED